METKTYQTILRSRRAEASVAQMHAADTVMAVTRIFVTFSPNLGLLRQSRSWARRWRVKVKH
jgi:hypothetical protein